jgi:hypothetical protein
MPDSALKGNNGFYNPNWGTRTVDSGSTENWNFFFPDNFIFNVISKGYQFGISVA